MIGFNMCKKCPNGCCRTQTSDVVIELWKRICSSKDSEIMMFGSNAVISFAELDKVFDEILKEIK